jgi:hypothetical protein
VGDDKRKKEWLANRLTHYLRHECKNRELKAYRKIVHVNWITLNRAKIEKARISLSAQ